MKAQVDKKHLLLLFALSLGLRLIFFCFSSPWENSYQDFMAEVTSDANGYHLYAIDILEHQTFNNPKRTPVYPLFISVIYAVFGIRIWVVLLIQIIVAALNTLLIYYLTQKLFQEHKISLIAALVHALSACSILYNNTLLSETIFIFAVLVALVCFLKAKEKRSLVFMTLSGFMLGIATLTRPIGQFLPLLIIIFLLFSTPLKLKFRLLSGLLIISFYAITISPWLYYNYNRYGHAKLTTIRGLSLLYYNASYTKALKTGEPLQKIRQDFREQVAKAQKKENNNPFDDDVIHEAIAFNYLQENWAYAILANTKGMVLMMIHPGENYFCKILDLETGQKGDRFFRESQGTQLILDFFRYKSRAELIIAFIIVVFLILVYLLALRAVFGLWQEKRFYELLFLVLLAAYFLVLTGATGNVRFRLTIVPYYAILAAYGARQLYQAIHKRNQTNAGK